MAATTKIMTAAEVISNAIVFANGFESEFFDKWILKTQRQYVKRFLGTDFYDEILTQIAASSLTSDNETLLDDYLKPMLAHYILYERLPQINNHVTNQGTTSQLDDFSNPAPVAGINLVRNQALADAQQYEQQADDFIEEAQEDDSSKYPLYECNKRNSNKYGIITY